VEESTAGRALRLLGVTQRKARRRIVRLVDVGGERVDGPIPFSPRVREILEDAYTGALWQPLLGKSLVGPSSEPSTQTPWGTHVPEQAPRLAAKPLGEVVVRTEDLLLALIAHGEGVAAHVLSLHGVDLEKAAVVTTRVRFPHAPQVPSGEWPPALPKPN
jgi:Clp amino terminal domain, pathogenicity island component